MISVLIPLYNKKLHIARAIDSVLGQTHQDFEIIVVDDGSTDGGGDIVAAYADPRIRLIRQANGGVSVARNRGIEAAGAELLAFLDADDAYKPDFLGNVLGLRQRFPEAVAYAMNCEVVGADGSVQLGVDPRHVDTQVLDLPAFFRIGQHGSPVFASAVVVQKRAMQQAGGFPAGVRLGEDIDTWIRLLFVGTIAFDHRPGGIYFNDASNRACIDNPPPASYRFFDTIDARLATHPVSEAERRDIEEFRNFFRLLYAHHQIRWGDAVAGRQAAAVCRTRLFRVEKLRLLALSYLPRACYEALARLKRALR